MGDKVEIRISGEGSEQTLVYSRRRQGVGKARVIARHLDTEGVFSALAKAEASTGAELDAKQNGTVSGG